MKRTGLKRKTPLRRTGGLKRVNKGRKARRDAEAFGEQAELCRSLPCVVCLPPGSSDYYQGFAAAQIECELSGGRGYGCQSDPHHIPTRGAGGVDKDTVPLCRVHHDEWHSTGEHTFAAKYDVDLRAVAAALHGELQKR